MAYNFSFFSCILSDGLLSKWEVTFWYSLCLTSCDSFTVNSKLAIAWPTVWWSSAASKNLVMSSLNLKWLLNHLSAFCVELCFKFPSYLLFFRPSTTALPTATALPSSPWSTASYNNHHHTACSCCVCEHGFWRVPYEHGLSALPNTHNYMYDI